MSNREKLEKFEVSMVRARLGRETVRSYLRTAEEFIAFCQGKGFSSSAEAVAGFLSTFPKRNLSVAYQKQALNALAGKNGLYKSLGKPVGSLPDWVRAKKPITVPAWVTKSETERICEKLSPPWALMVRLMFGAGLRVSEVTSLRWRDLDFERLTITVKQSKGKKDRITFLPASLVPEFRSRSVYCRSLWREDREGARPAVQVPSALFNRSKKAGERWENFWVFPAAGESRCPETGIQRRHHIHEKSFGKPLRKAVSGAVISKRVTAHAFRHGFATAYLVAGGNIRELRDLMGHQSIETTEVYLHCLPSFRDRVGSPLDQVSENVVPFVGAAVGDSGERRLVR